MTSDAVVNTMDELTALLREERWKQQDWTVNRFGGIWTCVRDGFARLVVTWIGRDQWVLTWEYMPADDGSAGPDWRVMRCADAEVAVEVDMILNALIS